jgi:probable HAF family extracellular repeat protein
VKNVAILLVLITSGAPGSVGGERQDEMSTRDASASYRIVTLKSLGGTNSRGNSINEWELVAGFSDLPGGQARRASLWFHGRQFALDTLGGPNSSVAWPVKNNIGLVVGIAQTDKLQPRGATWSCRIFFPGPDNTRYQCLGFAFEWGRMKRLPTLGGDNGFAAAANNRRHVVGWAENDVVDATCERPTQVLQFRAVLWDLNSNQTRELPPWQNDGSGAATAINDQGQVVGISGDCDQAVGRFSAKHAVIWEDGIPRKLDDLGGEAWNTPTAINQRGDVIAGFATAAGDNPFDPKLRAVVWTTRDGICDRLPGKIICDLGTLPDHVTSQASGVNDRGQVVGTSCPASGPCRAFIFEEGKMKDLNDSKGEFPDQLENAQDINEFGHITGRSINIQTQARAAFLATPTGPGSRR